MERTGSRNLRGTIVCGLIIDRRPSCPMAAGSFRVDRLGRMGGQEADSGFRPTRSGWDGDADGTDVGVKHKRTGHKARRKKKRISPRLAQGSRT